MKDGGMGGFNPNSHRSLGTLTESESRYPSTHTKCHFQREIHVVIIFSDEIVSTYFNKHIRKV